MAAVVGTSVSRLSMVAEQIGPTVSGQVGLYRGRTATDSVNAA